jgi:hypothetical protein
MPLSPPAPRNHRHTRTVTCKGFLRDDGLWDIEGEMIDVKTYDFQNTDRGGVKAGEPLHEMNIRVTIDEGFTIHEIEAASDHFPFKACPEVAPEFARLKGLRLGKKLLDQVNEIFAGPKGCTHLIELMGPITTTAYQTLWSTREKKAANEPARKRPTVIDRCHALAADGDVVKRQWPEFYEGKEDAKG